jgi:hypothetical protein
MRDLLDRRRFVAASASLGALAASGLGQPRSAAAQGRFRLFDCARFDGKPDLTGCGLEPIRVVYAGELWPGRDRDEPDLAFIDDKLVPKLQAEGPRERIVLDIEHWEVDELDKLVAIVELIRKRMPDVRYGYYATVPVQEYRAFQPGKEGRRIVYAELNRRWTRLTEAVDDLYPSFYTYYDDYAGWARMVDGVMDVARTFDRPIYPFLWPQYHETSRELSLKLINGDFWLQQLDKVRAADCAGAVIWGTRASMGRTPEGRIPRLQWDPSAPWWLQTKAFAEEAGLATDRC